MSKPRKDEPLKMPRYRGGETALKDFVVSNLKYPQQALEAKIEGPVEVSYDVDGLGRTFNIKITTSLGYGCDEEVIRLIKLLKFERAFNKGRNVTAHKKLKVDFKLPAPKPQQRQVSYHVTTAKQEQETKAPKPKSYTYNINLKN